MLKKELTPREREVLIALARGLKNTEIAKLLSVTSHTIKAHISSILRKFSCQNRTDVALYALKNGVIHLQDLERP